MNKKIFTLLASLLMLFMAAFGVKAQLPGVGDLVTHLPKGMGKGAYHLEVNVGSGVNATQYYVGMDEFGRLILHTEADLLGMSFKELRAAQWCVEVFEPEFLGQPATYHFVNKEYSTLLSVDSGRWAVRTGAPMGQSIWLPNGTAPFDDIPSQMTQREGGYNLSHVFVDGYYANWAFSRTYGTTALEYMNPASPWNVFNNNGIPLSVQIGVRADDIHMTFAVGNSAPTLRPGDTAPVLELVKVHGRDLNPAYGDPSGAGTFFDDNLARFKLVTAAPRVLNAEDFNTLLGEREIEDYVRLKFDPNTIPVGFPTNILDQDLLAVDAINITTPNGTGQYLNLKTRNNQYIYVSDGDNTANYYNTIAGGKTYPILRQGTLGTAGMHDFRFVYYPAEDSLVINVRRIDHIDDGMNHDDGTRVATLLEPAGDFFNSFILRHLIVKLQDLHRADGARVITVYDAPPGTRIHFGVKDCDVIDDRTTVPPNLYVIKGFYNKSGVADAKNDRYLVMTLDVGDFTPQWRLLVENEKPLKTPSSQWLVTPTTDVNSDVARVRIRNREFNWVYIDFVQVYSTPHLMKGTLNFWTGTSPGYSDKLFEDFYIYYDPDAGIDGFLGSFLVVEDDADVAAKIKAGNESKLTQDEWQRRYRTSPYLGYKYIAMDSLNLYAYAFNFLYEMTPNLYLHTPDERTTNPDGTRDTTVYVARNENYFQLHLPDTLEGYGTEKYGIGYGGDDMLAYESTKDIAKLERYYYYFQQNDYWNFLYQDYFLTLERDGRYVFAPEGFVNAKELNKAKFYLRFTYQPDKQPVLGCDNSYPEYYTLLDRIDQSNFEYFYGTFGLETMYEMKQYDASHGAWGSSGYGLVSATVNDGPSAANMFLRVQPKTAGSARVSTFTPKIMSEPLYRRFDVNALDCVAPAGEPRDYPRVLRIYDAEAPAHYLYEDQYSTNAYGKICMNCPPFVPYSGNGINFLGYESKYVHQNDVNKGVGHFEGIGTLPGITVTDHNYAIYLDTAYVNRGTGHIKPQYLLVMGPEFNDRKGCYLCGEEIEVKPWVYGRYLINARDSARLDASSMSSGVRDKAYIWENDWDRLAFVPAIHAGDTLYVLRGVDYMKYVQEDDFGVKYLNFKSLEAALAPWDIIALDDNYHKDVVFSMRFYERGNYENFLIESETTNRSRTKGRMIAPMDGGWLKMHDGEMVISRGSYKNNPLMATRWNTECSGLTREQAVGNEAISAVNVFAGQGTVTIQNAAGKQVIISNVLGQTVANTVLTSDNATIDAPKGIVIVAVEGEDAVKAVVK